MSVNYSYVIASRSDGTPSAASCHAPSNYGAAITVTLVRVKERKPPASVFLSSTHVV